MPDLTAAHKFHDEMVKMETRFVRDARRLYADFRRDALDIIDRIGLDAPELSRLIRDRLGVMASQIGTLAGDYVLPLSGLADDYAERSLAMIRDLEPAIPRFADLVVAAETGKQSIITDFLQTAANFVDVISARYLVDLDQARQTPDDPQAVRRLLSPELVDGRASTYRHGANTLRFESQRKVWTVAMAIAGLYFVAVKEQSGIRLQKQAVAVVDKYTTKCCLRLHGQIKDVDKPFKFGAPPCGSGRKQHPPFPGHECRTVESPYLPVLERSGLTTSEMVATARAELRNR